MLGLGLLAALLSLFFFSIGDTISKKASEILGHRISAAIVVGAGTIPLGISLLFVQPNVFSLGILEFTVISGAFGALGFILVFKSLETEQVTNTMVLVNLQYAIVVLFGILVLSESVGAPHYISLLVIFIGALLVTTTKGFKINTRLVPAILGTVCWGLGIVTIVYALTIYQNTTTMFFFFGRAMGFTFFLLYFLYLLMQKGGKNKIIPKKFKLQSLLLPLIAGISNGLALMMIVFVTLYKFVAIGGAILALEPILIAIYGYLFYKDKLTTLQLIGMVIAVLGGVMLNII